jgi:hypothetical protein
MFQNGVKESHKSGGKGMGISMGNILINALTADPRRALDNVHA